VLLLRLELLLPLVLPLSTNRRIFKGPATLAAVAFTALILPGPYSCRMPNTTCIAISSIVIINSSNQQLLTPANQQTSDWRAWCAEPNP
jgi:hypothetical protein